jgi:hypothetical protein
MSDLLHIYLPNELLEECKSKNTNFITYVDNIDTSSNCSKLFINNYQKTNEKTSNYSKLFIKSSNFNLTIRFEQTKIKINNSNFQKHLILIYKKNQHDLVYNNKKYNQQFIDNGIKKQEINDKITKKSQE